MSIGICLASKPIDEIRESMSKDYNTASPKLSVKQIAIGQISLFDNTSKVESILGQPDEKNSFKSDNGYSASNLQVYFYHKQHLVICFDDFDKVSAVHFSPTSKDDSTLKTPDGIGAGSTKYDVISTYGKEPFLDRNKQMESKVDANIMSIVEGNSYTYRAEDDAYFYLISFTWDKDDIVTNISIFHW